MFIDWTYNRVYIFYGSNFKYLPIFWLVLWNRLAQTFAHIESLPDFLFKYSTDWLMHFFVEYVLEKSYWNQKYWITNSFSCFFDTYWGCRTRFECRNAWWYLMNLFKSRLTGDLRLLSFVANHWTLSRWGLVVRSPKSNLPTWFDGWFGVWWMAPLWA
jgi:hypothetical protein